MKVELDDDDKAKLSRDLQIYAYQSLKEDTEKIIKEQFKILVAQEFRDIAKATLVSILEEENIDLKKLIKNLVLGNKLGIARWYGVNSVLDGYFRFNLETEIKNLFESEKEQVATVFKESVKEYFFKKLKDKF